MVILSYSWHYNDVEDRKKICQPPDSAVRTLCWLRLRALWVCYSRRNMGLVVKGTCVLKPKEHALYDWGNAHLRVHTFTCTQVLHTGQPMPCIICTISKDLIDVSQCARDDSGFGSQTLKQFSGVAYTIPSALKLQKNSSWWVFDTSLRGGKSTSPALSDMWLAQRCMQRWVHHRWPYAKTMTHFACWNLASVVHVLQSCCDNLHFSIKLSWLSWPDS